MQEIKNYNFTEKKSSFATALAKVREQPQKQNENKLLVYEYYAEIKSLLEDGYTLKAIAQQISEDMQMSEATFKKNYHTIKNEYKKRGKSKMAITEKSSTNTVISDFIESNKNIEKNENFKLLSDNI